MREEFEIQIKDFSVEQTAYSGQCFRMRNLGDGVWAILAGGHYVQVKQQGDRFAFSCGEDAFRGFWREYFDLGTDYGRIKAMADPEDDYLRKAMEFGWGVRVLRQNPWEMIMTFLISQNNNITRITNSVEALCKKFGERRIACDGFVPDCMLEDGCYYTFPSPEAVAAAGVEGLKDLGLGYRDKYLAAMAKRCCGEEGREWLEDLAQSDYETACGLLLKEFGVGKKVADCICLFGLYHVEAFPIDTHIRQILEVHYPKGFPYESYTGVAGIIQQYLFYYKLHG